jgi:hypothetical protein
LTRNVIGASFGNVVLTSTVTQQKTALEPRRPAQGCNFRKLRKTHHWTHKHSHKHTHPPTATMKSTSALRESAAPTHFNAPRRPLRSYRTEWLSWLGGSPRCCARWQRWGDRSTPLSIFFSSINFFHPSQMSMQCVLHSFFAHPRASAWRVWRDRAC